jgi:hypothetical protein
MADDLTTEAQLRKAIEEAATLKAQLANAEQRAKDLEPHKLLAEQTKAELKAEREAAAAKLAQYEAEAAERVWKDVGIEEPDVRAAFQWQYGQLPADGKPEFGEWIGSLSADPAQAPTVLRPFLGAGKPQGAPPAAVQPQATPRDQRPKVPDANAGARPVQPAAAAFTAEQVKRMTPAEFMANLPALRASNPQVARAFPELPGSGKGQ